MRRPGKAAAKQVVREQSRQQRVQEEIHHAANRISSHLTSLWPLPTPEARAGTRLWKQMELSRKELRRAQEVLMGWDDPLSRAYRCADPEAPGHNFTMALGIAAGVQWVTSGRMRSLYPHHHPFASGTWLHNEMRIMSLINALHDQGAGVDFIDPDCPVPVGGVERVAELTAEQIEKMADWLIDHPAEEEQYALDACAYMLALEWMTASADALIDWVEEVDATTDVHPGYAQWKLPEEEWAKLQVADKVFMGGKKAWY